MAGPIDAEAVREVVAAVDHAIAANRRTETALQVMVLGLAASGAGLLALGAYHLSWPLALPGSLCELAVGYPLRALVQIRRENVRLAVLPQMMRLAASPAEKRAIFRMLERIISGIGP